MTRPLPLAPTVLLLLAASLVGLAAPDAQGVPRQDSARQRAAAADSAHERTAPPRRPFTPGPPPAICTPSPDTVAPPDSLLRPLPALVPTPRSVRGLYVNRWAAIGHRMWELIDVARRTEINTLVIDVKDDRGLVLYPSRVPLAHEIGADTVLPMRLERMRAVLDTMRTYGIYPVARIVVAKDPLLAEHHTEWAIRKRADPSAPWLDDHGKPWLDPHHPQVWRYATALACEAVSLGFSEVQFDYVRFPDDDAIRREAVFPLAAGRTRAEVIREQLRSVRAWLRPLGVPVTADVFGLTTSDTTDMGIGQRWEMFVDAVDVVLPMMYPSHYAPGSYHLGNPNAHPYEVIDHGLRDARERSEGIVGAARVVPWYQDFTLGAPRYGAAQVRAQIRAGYDNGITSWVLWNPGSRYTLSALEPESPAAASGVSADDARSGAARAESDSGGGAPLLP
ncbi:MAG TPA: putative glycoside hydrolase [Gemmatimonadaceae bacterium]|nr:putative glycoside hydrolase [Gemmatimonadaceae bacterium]